MKHVLVSRLIAKIVTVSIAVLCLINLSSCLQAGEGLQGKGGPILAPRDAYPEGPYGEAIGDTIAPLSFIDVEGNPFSLASLHQDYFNQVILITTSAEWCTACIKEQPKLEELYNTYRDRGLNVVVTMFQDSNFAPADADLAARWRDKYNLSFPVLADPVDPSTFSPYYDVNLTPMVMLLDVATMEILYLTQGFDEDQVRVQIEARLPESLSRPRTYPEGPYGEAKDETIADLSLTNIDGSPWRFGDLYRDLSKSLLLLTTSAEWCTACIKEQPKLKELYQEFGDQGLAVLVSMFQDSNFEPATPEVAERWRDKYDLSFDVVADTEDPSILSAYYDINLTPMVMLIDLSTMSIVYLNQGFDEDQVRIQIEANLGGQ